MATTGSFNAHHMRIVLPEGRPFIDVPIESGETVRLSPVLATDREYFEKGLEMLSIESRFARFGHGVAHLSDRELDYLSDVDQRSHVAWGAIVSSDVAGVGRFVSAAGDDDCPELALTVLDEFQGRGVGTALIRALVAVARHDGIEELCFEAGAGNPAVLRMMAGLEPRPLLDGRDFERRLRLADLPIDRDDGGFVAVIEEVRARQGESS